MTLITHVMTAKLLIRKSILNLTIVDYELEFFNTNDLRTHDEIREQTTVMSDLWQQKSSLLIQKSFGNHQQSLLQLFTFYLVLKIPGLKHVSCPF